MSHLALIGMLACGLAFWLLPLVLPLFFCSKVQRKGLFYLVGLACSFACYKVAPLIWGFSSVLLGNALASMLHEGFQKATEYSFALAVPGLNQGYLFMGMLPALFLGTLMSVIVLRKLKCSLFGVSASPGNHTLSNPDGTDPFKDSGGAKLSDGYRPPL